MATEADIAKPICEPRGEQGENLVYQATNISIGKLHQEEKIQADTYDELSTVEGGIFLKTPSIGGEVHYDVNKNTPDISKVNEKLSHVKDETEILPPGKPDFNDQPVEIAADEESSIQQNVEKSNDLEKDDDRGMVTEQCSTDSQVMTSEIKAGDTLDHPDLDDARLETEQSIEIKNDHHGTNNSFTEKIALPQEMLKETSLQSEETKKIEEKALQSEEQNVHVEMTDEKAGDGKKTEEVISCNLTTEVSRGECDQNKKTSEPDGLGKEGNFEDDLDSGADKGGRENNMFKETTSNETSNSDEFQSKNNLNSFSNKEDDIAIQKDDSPATTSEDSNIMLENTLNESSGDVESQSKILEDHATKHSDPDLPNKSEESSCIQVDGSEKEHDEQSEEESKNLILTEVSTGGTSNSESTPIAKVKDEDEGLKKAELLENEKNTSTSLKGDHQIENPAESLHVCPENIEASNLSQEKEKGNCPEDQSTDINLYENTGGDTKEKSIDAVNTQREILESISTIASSSSEEGSTNAVLPEAPRKDINKSIIDADDTQQKVIENVSTISNEDVERNSIGILDGVETNNDDHLGNESEKPSLPLPFSREATNKDESILLHEARIEDGEERKAEFCENEITTESMVLKTDSKTEKSEDSSEKIKEPDVDEEIEISSFDEQNASILPQQILDDKTENVTVNAAEIKEDTTEIHDVPKIVPNENMEENSLIKYNGPEKENEKQLDKDTEQPSLTEDFTGNNLNNEVRTEDERTDDKTIDVAITSEETQELQNVSDKDNEDSSTQVDASNIEQNTYLKEEEERSSLTKAQVEDANDNESSILAEPKIDNECPKEVELFGRENNKNGILLEKKDLQDAPEDHTASISSADIETTRSFDEESLVMRDNTIDVTDSKEITLEVQNVATKTPYEHMEENSFAQVSCSQREQEKHLEGTENSFSPDTPTEEINSDESQDIHEPENSSKDSTKVAKENEIYTESASVKEEAQVEKHIDSLQLAVEDIKASDSSQDGNSIQEQISTADPQEISSDKTKEESIDIADGNEESLEPQDIATNTSDGNNADNSPTEEDDSENPHLKEATTWKNNDEPTIMHEAELVVENEKSAECTLVKEEAHIESSGLAADEVGESAFDQDRETSTPDDQNLRTYPQGIVDDSKENKTSDTASAEQGTPEDKDIPKSTPCEDIEENLHIQFDSAQLEQNEDLENSSENTSLREAPTGETMGSTLIKEKAQEEKPIDSSQVAEEEMKTHIASQETRSTEEKTLVPNQQEISCNNTQERDINAYNEKENLEDAATNVPNGSDDDNSPIEVDGSQKPSSEEATTGNNNDEESIVTQEAELVGEKENHIECTLKKDEVHTESLQVAAHDIKASALGQERETSPLVEQSLTTTLQGGVNYTKEDKSDDATGVVEQTPEQDIVKTTPYEDIEEKLLDQVDCSQLEQNDDLKNDIDNKPFIVERTFINEEAQVEKPIESLQATSASCQESSSIEEKILTVNLQEEKTNDATYTRENLEDVVSNVPNGNGEANLPLEVDGVKKPSLDEASTANTNDDLSTTIHDAKCADENIVNAVLLENEENEECAFINEEVSVKSLQVEIKDTNTTTSSRDEANCLEKQDLITNSEGIVSDYKEDKTADATDLKEETLEDKSNATSSHEDILQDSLVQMDCSQLEQNEHSEKENESASLQEAPIANTTKDTLVYEEAPVKDHIEPLQVATEDIKAFAPRQDGETSSTEEQFLIADLDDVSRDKTIEKIDAIDKEITLEVQDATRNVPHGENLTIEEDGSQKPSLKEASTEDTKDHESTITQEVEFVDESLQKDDSLDHEKNTEDLLVKADISIETSQAAVGNINTSNLSEDTETISREEQIGNENIGRLTEEEKDSTTIGSTDQQKETHKDEVPKEIETADNEAKKLEFKEEVSYLKDLQITTTVNRAAHEEKDSNSAAEKLPRTEDLNVNNDVVGHTSEDPNWKQEESSITDVSEEHKMTSNEDVPGIAGLESETTETIKDHKVVEVANTCGDRTDIEKIGVLDDGSISIPENETLAETDPRESTEADVQVSIGEEAEIVQEDLKTETVQDIEEQLIINASHVVSELKGVNGEEDTTDSDNCKATSRSSNFVALKEVASFNVAIEENSTSDSFQEASRETREQAENKEAQKQEEKLHDSALIEDSSTEKVKEDVQSCVASANDSDITQGMQKVQEVPLLAPEEKIIETKECKETEVEEGANRNKERDDTIEIFLDDKKATERKQEETKSTQEEFTLDEEVETTKSKSVTVPADFLQVPLGHIPEVDHSMTGREATTDKEELHTGEKALEDNEDKKIQQLRDEDEIVEQKTSEVSPAASILIEAENQEVATLVSEASEEDFTEKYIIEANPHKGIDSTEDLVINESKSLQGILVNNGSTRDLESKIDEEAPDISEPIPTATEGQDTESTSVKETSTYIGGTTEERSDSIAPEKAKSGYEPENQMLESVAEVQAFDIISETEQIKIEEGGLESAAEIKSEEIVAQEIIEQKETTYEKEIIKENISSQKINDEGEDVEDCHQDSHEEEVITKSHGEEINTEEIYEVLKNENEIEKVSKIYKEANDKAPEGQEENLLANKSIDRSLQPKELANSVEEDATILHTEGDHGLDIAYVKTETYDSNKEIISSTVAFPEEDDNRIRAGDTGNEMAEYEGLLKKSKVPAIDAAAELPKGLNEHIICEAPPTATVHKEELHTGEKAIEDNEDTKIQEVRDEDKLVEQKTSEVSPAASTLIEAEDQEVATLVSEAPEEEFTEKYIIEANDPHKGIDTTEGLVIIESTSLQGILVNNGSTTDLESKIDEEAPDISEPIPTATEGQDTESTSVKETSTYIGGTIEERSDSIAPEEANSGYEPENQVLESVARVQAFDIISEKEQTKIEEGGLKSAAEIKSEEIVAQEILEQKETIYEKEIIKDNISSQKINDEGEDVEDCHQDSHEEEIITKSHLEEEATQGEEINTEEISEVKKNENEIEKMSKLYKEADDKAPEEQEENLLANESIDRSLLQKEQAKSVEEDATILHTEEDHGLEIEYANTGTCDSNKEINSSTVAFPEEDNITGAGNTDNEMAEYEGLLNNSKIPAIDAAAELSKGLNEDIICEAPPTAIVNKTIEDFEAKKGNADAIMMLQQEDSTFKHEILPELARGKESEEQSQKDETCSSNEMQAEDEEKLKPSEGKSEEENKADTWRELNEEDKETCVEANILDCSSDTKSISEYSISNGAHDMAEDNENSDTKIKSSGEEFPNKSIGSQISTVSDEIELTEQASEATRISPDMKEPDGGIDSRATISNATGVESRQVEDVNDKCTVMEETSIPVDSHMTSNIIQECTVGSSLEVKDQQTKPLELPQELNMRGTEVDFAEKDDPENLQNVRDIREDVQEVKEGSSEASNKENTVEAVPDGNIQTSERQEAEGIQIAVVPENLEQETEDHELGRTFESVSKVGVNCEEEKTISEKTNQFEDSWSAEIENVSESSVHQSFVNEVAQHDKNKESRPDFETAEKDPPSHFAGLEGTYATDLEVTPLPSKDKHIVLEADYNKSPYPENLNGKESISVECAQGEHEIQEQSKVEKEEPECGDEERTDQETREKLELEKSNKPSLSDLFDVSMRQTSQMENRSVIEKEPTTHGEDLKAERIDEAEHEDAKLEEEKGDEEESSEQKRSELGEAPVMVDMGDADVKASHKKSHNILSGVGSKVKHSLAKVKKAITGKSSHPKPPSPKKVIT